ncbi:MAG: hypothetical protein ABL949_17055 [Fimbriimonadaceae bacterium]
MGHFNFKKWFTKSKLEEGHDPTRISIKESSGGGFDIPDFDIEQLATILVYTSQEHLTSYWRGVLYQVLREAETRARFRAAFCRALIAEAEFRVGSGGDGGGSGPGGGATIDILSNRPLSREVSNGLGELMAQDLIPDRVREHTFNR